MIVITGVIGTDKKSFCKFLKRNFKKIVYKSKLQSTYCKIDFYEIIEHLLNYSKIEEKNVMEFCIEDHPIFLKKCIIPAMLDYKMISQREEDIFNKIYDSTVVIPENLIFVALITNINYCFEKLIEDNITIDFKFLQKIEKYYKQWIKSINAIKIEINEDIENNEKIQKDIVKVLMKNNSVFSALIKL